MDVPGCGHIDRNIANLLVASESYGGGIGITRVSNRGGSMSALASDRGILSPPQRQLQRREKKPTEPRPARPARLPAQRGPGRCRDGQSACRPSACHAPGLSPESERHHASMGCVCGCLHSRLWPIPAAAVVAAIGVGVALTNLEELYGRGAATSTERSSFRR